MRKSRTVTSELKKGEKAMNGTQIKPDELRHRLRSAGLPVVDVADLEMNDDGPVQPPDLPEPFSVRDEATANWLVRKIAECRAYAMRVSAWAAAETLRAEREEQFFWHHYGSQLESWATEEVRKLKRGRKSFNLPAGSVGFRSERPKLVITDEKILLDWCRRNLPEALNLIVEASGLTAASLQEWQRLNCPDAHISEEVTKSVVNEHAQSTGEVPDGTEWFPAGDKFYVK